MNSFIASPEFDTEEEVGLWLRKQKAAPITHELLTYIVRYCVKNEIEVKCKHRNYLAIAQQLLDEIGGDSVSKQIQKSRLGNRTPNKTGVRVRNPIKKHLAIVRTYFDESDRTGDEQG